MGMSDKFSLSDWSRCPRCGDDGEVVYGLSGLSGSITFKCESRDHRLNRRFYSKYKRDDRVQIDSSKSLLSKVLTPYSMTTRLDETMADCFECPSCGGAAVNGGIEHLKVEYDITRSLQGLCVTLWCSDCGNYNRNLLLHNTPFPDKEQEELFVSESQYPPSYIDR
jgi:hypothetical protein